LPRATDLSATSSRSPGTQLARQRYDEAVRALKRVSPYCHQVLEEYCFDERHVALWGDWHLAKGLDALANLWGMIDRGINEGKPI